MHIRLAEEMDAERLSNLIRDVENTAEYMLYGPGERKYDIENKRKLISSIQAENNSAIFLAEDNNELTGYLIAKGGGATRNVHTAYIVVGILDNFRGQGIGSRLFQALTKWAKEKELHRLELTVVTHNEAGIRLYKKQGFEVEGTKKHSLRINGEFADEYYMAKLL
jgi:RimJ/RimL family protein N-acetyltransferase